MRIAPGRSTLLLVVIAFCAGGVAAQPAGPIPKFSCDYLGQAPPG